MTFPLAAAGLLSKNGRKKNKTTATIISRTASVSPLINRTWAGNIFKVWNRNKKYHSGFIPSGAGAITSAALSKEGGKKWYNLVYGNFKDKKSATAEIKNLPKTVKNWSPKVRRFSEVHSNMSLDAPKTLLKKK